MSREIWRSAQTGPGVLGATEGTLSVIQTHSHLIDEDTEAIGVKGWV